MADHIQVVSRILRILHILALRDTPFSLDDISKETQLPKSTAHRLLKTLEIDDAVRKVRPGLYTIGRSIICLGAKVVRSGIVFRAAEPMTKLRDITDCTVYLVSIDNDVLVYLHRVPGVVAPTSDAGYTGDVFWSTGGRAMLSTYSDEQIEKLFKKKKKIVPRTKYSLKTKEEIIKEIKITRRRGYSKANNEYTVGVSGIGAPIFDYSGECIAGLSLVAVVGTISVAVESYAKLLLETAKEISEMLGHSS